MCFGRSRHQYWEERLEDETRDRSLWDLFYRETERGDEPMPVAEQDEDSDRDQAPVSAGH